MTYPSHYLLQFGGPRGTANDEIWTCGIRMITVPAGSFYTVEDAKAYLDDVCVPALNAWFSRSESFIHSTAKINFAKLNRINSQGQYADPTTVANFYASAVAGGVSVDDSAASIPQSALVLTWETFDVSRGPGSRGRIYSPAPALKPAVGTGLFPSSQALTAAESAATLIEDLRGGGSAGAMTPNIVSDSGTGVAHRIDVVSVDNRIDIQRKRANSLSPVRVRFEVDAA